MITIKAGEAQPVPCHSCGCTAGYGYSDHIAINYSHNHAADGSYDGGGYTEFSKALNKGKTPYCCNCGTKLKFKLDRLDSENNNHD